MCYIPPFATSNCNNVQLFIIMLCLSYGNYYNELSYQELIVLRNLELSVLCDSKSLLLKKKKTHHIFFFNSEIIFTLTLKYWESSDKLLKTCTKKNKINKMRIWRIWPVLLGEEGISASVSERV